MLEEVRDRLRKGQLPRAMALLVKAWRDEPLPRLAKAIDALAERLPLAPIEGKSQKEWIQHARAGKPDELSGLLATLCAGTIADTEERIAALGEYGRDPRIASALLRIVRDAPFTSNGSRRTWIAVFDRLAALEDPRVIDQVPEAKLGWAFRAAQRDWLGPRADALVERMRQRFPDGAPNVVSTTAKLLDEIDAAIADGGQAKAPAGKGEASQDLLAEIFRSPHDDKRRSVYADWLGDRGDPRGEFISLQLHADRTKQMLARERALLKKHERDWIGRIAPVVNKADTEFQRGFLVACHVRFKSERDVRAYGSLAEWATVERLHHGLPGSPPRDQMKWLTWIDPVMKSLRDVDVFPESLPVICAAPEPWLIERIRWGAWQSREIDDGSRRLLETTDKLPKLNALVFMERPSPGWLPKTRFAPQLREIAIQNAFGDDDEGDTFAELLKDVAKLPNLERLAAFIGWKQNVTFTRDASGRYSLARAEMAPASPWNIGSALDQLPVGSLTELEIAVHPEFKAQKIDPTRLPQLRAACQRHKLKRLDLSAIEG
jgi:uncharacterized protein (TIGR02996 family)